MIIFSGYREGYPEHNMGDAILTIPFITYMANLETVYLQMHNEEVRELIDHPNIKPITQLYQATNQNCLRLSINDVILTIGRDFHPSVGLFKLFDVKISEEVLTPKINFKKQKVEKYDYVISPFTEDKNREWDLNNWNKVLPYLGKVAIIGSIREPIPWTFDNVDYIYGESLDYVCSLLEEADKIVTIDTGPSRLAHALNLGNKHYILCSCVVPLVWGTYPEAKKMYGIPRDWTSESVLDFIK